MRAEVIGQEPTIKAVQVPVIRGKRSAGSSSPNRFLGSLEGVTQVPVASEKSKRDGSIHALALTYAERTAWGVDPVHAWNARTKELGSSKPSRNEISAPDIDECCR